ncbi:hypothetical protein N7492_002485, partial [Penicillium capsulatum]
MLPKDRLRLEDELEKATDRSGPQNPIIMQGFEWHVPADRRHWHRLYKSLPSLKEIGVDNIWIPPGCKGMDPSGMGYDLYDLYDLGEFDQKGSRATRWGSKEDLERMIQSAQDLDIGIIWDTVLNHKAGADFTENFQAIEVDPEDRNIEFPHREAITGWVGFDFPGRGAKYSAMRYRYQHFNGVDWDDTRKRHAIFKISNPRKDWAADVSDEHGNYDYLMFANLDHTHPEVRADIFNWSEWLGTELPISGMRIDAAKHYSVAFQCDFVNHLRKTVGPNYLLVSEYWRGEVGLLVNYLKVMNYGVSLFDVPLLGKFAAISKTERGDLRRIFKETLVEKFPHHAVTFVGNHDTQPGQSLETIITPFFKPIAYSLILLRSQGLPCVFYGDLYGLNDSSSSPKPWYEVKLPALMRIRKLYAHGKQHDYFDKRNCIGFVRFGNVRHPSGLACLISNSTAAYKWMYVGLQHRYEEWTDVLGHSAETVIIDSRGYGIFAVAAKSVSVWVDRKANGRDTVGRA